MGFGLARQHWRAMSLNGTLSYQLSDDFVDKVFASISDRFVFPVVIKLRNSPSTPERSHCVSLNPRTRVVIVNPTIALIN